MLDPSVGVYRINGRALRDGIVGWVTVAGNQGITFLMPGGNLFKIVRPARMTQALTDLEGSEGEVRQLALGDALEVIAWDRHTENNMSVTRIKAKVQGEDSVGWVSVTEGGAVTMEVV
eukprot:TRINITY_DN4619_c0_g2_i3.p1 TRINITY_DN4619_c0_g2~~TRINITY_DN4619_c0_g2_i3.p1  ORF type:complete len:118 (-),score=28.83 TRINITY_DN4619_c0_g2_i3:407-760(-)